MQVCASQIHSCTRTNAVWPGQSMPVQKTPIGALQSELPMHECLLGPRQEAYQNGKPKASNL